MARTIRRRWFWLPSNKQVHIDKEINRVARWYYQWYGEPMPIEKQNKEKKSAEREWVRSNKDLQPKHRCTAGLKGSSRKFRRSNERAELHKVVREYNLDEHEFNNCFDLFLKGFGWFYD